MRGGVRGGSDSDSLGQSALQSSQRVLHESSVGRVSAQAKAAQVRLGHSLTEITRKQLVFESAAEEVGAPP